MTNDVIVEINNKLQSDKGKELINLFEQFIACEMELIYKTEFSIISENFWKLFYKSFTLRDCLTILGIRKTLGSADHYPPELFFLLEGFCTLNSAITEKNKSFNENQNKKKKGLPSILTVGGRALSKHYHRSSENFWPNCTGKEKEKNDMAFNIANKLIKECCWINIHQLPGDLPIIELRIKEGYGIRWQLDGFFRGFLEPQFPDGHEKGWKH